VTPTTDLCDDHGDAVQVLAGGFGSYGGVEGFHGPVSTVAVFEDNSLVRDALAEPGDGRVLVVAHGNSLRAMVKFLEEMSEEEIMQYNIPTGIPLVYRLDDDLGVIGHDYIADEATLAAAVSEVKNQASAKA